MRRAELHHQLQEQLHHQLQEQLHHQLQEQLASIERRAQKGQKSWHQFTKDRADIDPSNVSPGTPRSRSAAAP
eukprot:767230-Hanusia_phi.AAC.12